MAEDLELVHEVAGATLGVHGSGIEVTAQVAEASRRVGEQVPDDDEDRASHRHDGPQPLETGRPGASVREPKF